MGYLMLVENVVINPSVLGWSEGTEVSVICVGGGGGGTNAAAGRSSINYPGGSGFGAGGAGNYYSAGGAGEIKYSSAILKSSTDPIAITIGERGGINGNGGTTSFGSYVSASGGIASSFNGNGGGQGGYMPNARRGVVSSVLFNDARYEPLSGVSPLLPFGVSSAGNTSDMNSSRYNTAYDGGSLPVPGYAGCGAIIIEW